MGEETPAQHDSNTLTPEQARIRELEGLLFQFVSAADDLDTETRRTTEKLYKLAGKDAREALAKSPYWKPRIRCPLCGEQTHRKVEAEYVERPDRRFVEDGLMADEVMHLLYESAWSVRNLGDRVEVGVWKGKSTSSIALVGPTVCIDSFEGTLDNPTDTEAEFWSNVGSMGLRDRIQLIRARSDDALKFLRSGAYSFVLIDGDHEEEQPYRDLVEAWRILKSGGVLWLDDWCWSTGVEASRLRFEQEVGLKFICPPGSDKTAYLYKP